MPMTFLTDTDLDPVLAKLVELESRIVALEPGPSPPPPPPPPPPPDGTILDVGPGLPYHSLASVPWDALLPGNEVRIHWKDTPYAEKVIVCCRGTQEAPIRIVGVPGAGGELPVLTGVNATTSQATQSNIEAAGLLSFWRLPSQPADFRPGHVIISGLEITGAGHHNGTNTFLGSDGLVKTWADDAGGVWIGIGDGIEIADCNVHHNGNGIFCHGAYGNSDIAVLRNHIHANGWTGANFSHNTYIEAFGAVYEDNIYGRPVPTGVVNLKDRSCGTVIRRNRFEGGARCIDLGSAQDSNAVAIARDDYYLALVEHNTFELLAQDAGAQIMFLEGRTDNQGRTQAVDFNSNTVVYYRDAYGYFVAYNEYAPAALLRMDNNLIFATSPTGAVWGPVTFLFRNDGSVQFTGRNLMPEGWIGSQYGAATNVTGSPETSGWSSDPGGRGMNDPGFVDLAGGDYTLRSDSPYFGMGA